MTSSKPGHQNLAVLQGPSWPIGSQLATTPQQPSGITSAKGPEPGSRTQPLFGFVFQKAQQEIFGLTRWAQHGIHALPIADPETSDFVIPKKRKIPG